MRKNNRAFLKYIFAAALGLTTSSAWSAYEDLGVSARVMGLGNAFTAVSDDVYSIYYNPAGLATLPRPEIATTYSRLYPGLSDNSNIQNNFLAYAQPLDNGRQGGFGVALNYFTLDNLYHETSLYGSYGRDLLPVIAPDKLYGGVSLKYLNRGLSNFGSLANSPIGPTGQIVSNASDPVLQNTSKTNFDMDWGLLYRLQPQWTLGMMVEHFLEPNIAFGGSPDILSRNYKFGAAYKAPFALLSADLDYVTAPDMQMDEIATLAAEKWLPTLNVGTFGVRGSLGVGTRSYRQLSAGVSYKIYRMEFDYGMEIPFGGISGTYGTQRVGITFFLGRSRVAEPSYGEAILENMGELAQVGTPEFSAQLSDLSRYEREAIETFLSRARVQAGKGDFAGAYDNIEQALSINNGDQELLESSRRLKAVVSLYPDVKDFSADVPRASLYEGIIAFLAGKDAKALDTIAYARSLSPMDDKLGYLESIMKGMMEGKSQTSIPLPAVSTAPIAAPVVSTVSGAVPALKASTAAVSVNISSAAAAAPITAVQSEKSVVEGDTTLMEVSLARFEYDKVLELGDQVIKLDPTNALAYLRMGVANYRLKRYAEALKALNSALGLTHDGKTRKTLRSYIKAINSIIGGGSVKVKKAAPTPAEIENLYNAGVEFYVQGRLEESAQMFRNLLSVDPENTSAQKALKRVEAEMQQSGERKQNP